MYLNNVEFNFIEAHELKWSLSKDVWNGLLDMTARMSPVNDGVKQNRERKVEDVYGRRSHRTQRQHGEKDQDGWENTQGSKKRNSQVVWQEEKETGEEQEQPIKLSVWAGGFFRV